MAPFPKANESNECQACSQLLEGSELEEQHTLNELWFY